MAPRRRIPRSGWRSSNLSPYNEDLAIPAHVRKQRRLTARCPPSGGHPIYESSTPVDEHSGDVTEAGLNIDGVIEGVPPGHEDILAGSPGDVGEPSVHELNTGLLDRLSPFSPDQTIPPSPRPLSASVHEVDDAGDSDGTDEALVNHVEVVSSDSPPPSPARSPIRLEDSMRSRASKFLPGEDRQVELHHLSFLLRTLVQASANVITVVDHHDFVEAVSFVDLAIWDNRLVQRLRLQLTLVGSIKKQILIPIHYDGHIILAHIVKCRKLRFQAHLYGPDSRSLQDNWYSEPEFALMQFMRRVFPEETAAEQWWMRGVERTFEAEAPLDPRLFIENLGSGLAVPRRFKHVLPIFFQALLIVSGLPVPGPRTFKMPPEMSTRLLAAFSRDPFANDSLLALRNDGQELTENALQGRLHETFYSEMARVTIVAADKIPRDIVQAKWKGRLMMQNGVARARQAALDFADAHHYLHGVIEALRNKTGRTLVRLKYEMLGAVVGQSELPLPHGHNEVLASVKALTEWELEETVQLQVRIDNMREELVLWDLEFRSLLRKGLQE